ncbi:hypothetical protein PYW08_012934 [Mythimna loreyi]|uniref:Uncharacterized protein n=1 Tax=Mythimna loreyi TaxID=667449 RepID=A0ACC2PYN1_9NEOP|nr:hypothetical protein PYW08_012934 [Mythimna loreyi]
MRTLAQQEPVMIRDYTKSNRKWTEGVVAERTGPVSYIVTTSDGRTHKRHIDQLQTRKSRHSLSKTINVTSDENNSKVYVAVGSETKSDSNGNDEYFDSVGEENATPSARASSPPPPSTPPVTDNTNRVRRKAAIRCQEILKKN